LYGKNFNRADTMREIDADIFIVSFPKSGRTWLRYILSRYIAIVYGEDSKLDALKLYDYAKEKRNIKSICFTHDGSGFMPLNINPIFFDTKKEVFKKKRVILMVRDPRDTVNSFFYHNVFRTKRYRHDKSTFIRNGSLGIRKIIKFLNSWSKKFNSVNMTEQDRLLIRYEDIHDLPLDTLRLVVEFCGLKLDQRALQLAHELSSFDQMKKKSRQSATIALAPVNVEDERTYKVRKGIKQAYLNDFNKEDLAYLNREMRKLSKVFAYEV
jgi:hypothetical protein